MKVVFNVRNADPNKKLGTSDVLLWDATKQEWYITDKSELLNEFYSQHNEAIINYENKYNAIKNEFDEFKATFSEQYKQIVDLMKILTEQERNKTL